MRRTEINLFPRKKKVPEVKRADCEVLDSVKRIYSSAKP